MTIEQLWLEMEAEAGANVAWLTRFARPQTGHPLLVALEQTTRARALLVPVSKAALPPRREWPECRGLEMISVALGSQPHLGVRLRDPACADVFTALAEDVAPRVASASGAKQAAAELLGRLRRWQQFLTTAREAMSIEAQRGLWGELHVLRTHLLPALDPAATVAGWKASAAAHQDFQFSGGAVEVKTTAAKQPQSVRITSERQLDDTGVGALFLHVVVVDEREVESSRRGDEALIPLTPALSPSDGAREFKMSLLTSVATKSGQSLPALIADTRADLSADPVALAAFNDRLLDRGWLDAHASRYEGRRWTVRDERTYQVRRGFPRLVEVDLPTGVGDVNFAVSLAACEPFAAPLSGMLGALSQTNPRRRGRPPTP
jgi:hypothetical protein